VEGVASVNVPHQGGGLFFTWICETVPRTFFGLQLLGVFGIMPRPKTTHNYLLTKTYTRSTYKGYHMREGWAL
jgi:hypothetical protein